MTTLFIFAGEQSGDLHGSRLMQILKSSLPHLHLFGVGGPAMRGQGMETIMQMEDFEVMGFTDVILALPKLLKRFNQVFRAIMDRAPKVVLLIDYPGFNLRLAKALRKKGFKGKIIQYICPSVWAHGKQRIQQMASTLDMLLCILPFEPAYFEKTGLKAVYVGNPLQEYIKTHRYQEGWKTEVGIPLSGSLIALFPGSRLGEVERNLPAMLKAAEKIQQEGCNCHIALSCAHPGTEAIAKKMLPNCHAIFFVPKRYTYELMRDSQAAVAKSGTVTLELALHQCPAVVIYQLTWLNHLLAKWILRLNLPHYALPNILIGRSVFPELIAQKFSSTDIYVELKALLDDPFKRKACLDGCREISALLREEHASEASAALIGEFVS